MEDRLCGDFSWMSGSVGISKVMISSIFPRISHRETSKVFPDLNRTLERTKYIPIKGGNLISDHIQKDVPRWRGRWMP